MSRAEHLEQVKKRLGITGMPEGHRIVATQKIRRLPGHGRHGNGKLKWRPIWLERGMPFGDRIYWFLKPMVAWHDRRFAHKWAKCFGCDRRRLKLNALQVALRVKLEGILGRLKGH